MISRKAFSVARWEFVERVKTKSFIIGLFLTPAIMALFSVVPSLLRENIVKQEQLHLLVYDGTGVLLDSVTASVARAFTLPDDRPLYVVTPVGDETSMEEAKGRADERILAETLEAAVLIPSTALDSLHVEYRARNVSDIENISRLESIVSGVITSYKLTHAGLDPVKVGELNRRADLRTVRVTPTGEKQSGFLESFGISYVFIIMLMIMILSSGQMLVRSMVEEKSNRIVEVLVSSCSATDLMFGKIIGLSLLGIVQLSLWVVIGVVLVLASGITGLPLDNLWLMIVYFFLGFLLYAGIFVMFGCLASTEQEAQQMTGYLSIFLSLPLVIAMIAVQNPNSPLLVGLSFVPLLTPSMMILRLPILTPPAWQIAASLAGLVLSIAVVVWIAAKVFRVGILLTGKRPTLDEIVRWIRS